MADQTARPAPSGFSTPRPGADGSRRAEDTRRLHILLADNQEARGSPPPGAPAQAADPDTTLIRAFSLAHTLQALASRAFDVVLLELDLIDSTGLPTLNAVQPHLGEAALVILTETDDDPVVLEAMRAGARDYLLRRDLDPGRLRRALRYALERRTGSRERGALRQLQATLDALRSHIAVLDHAGTIVLVNEAWRRFAAQNGYLDPAAGVGTSYVQVCQNALGPDQAMAREVATAIREVAAGALDSWEGEYACHSPTERRFFCIQMTACPDPDLAVVVHHDNVTARRQLEEALRSSNERFALVQLATNDVIWDWELSGPLDSSVADVAGWADRVHPRDLDSVLDGLNAALREGDAWTAEYRYRRGDGSYAAVYDRRYVLRGEAGHAVRLIGSMQDVTEQHRLTTALEQSEAHYRRLVERAPQMIYGLDRAGRFTEINPAGVALLQQPHERLLGGYFSALVEPEDIIAAEELFMKVVAGRTAAVEAELRIRRPSGEARWLHINAAAILEGDAIVGAHGIARDITDERERESRMRLFAAALENLTESVNVLDAEGRIVYANAAHARMLGHDPAAPPAEGIESFAADPAARQELRAAQAVVRDEGVWRGRLQMRGAAGAVIPVEAHMERVAQDGRSLVFTICRDVTAELEQEHRLRRAERLASVGTLVGGVAHELNNPLAAIMGFAQLLLLDERTPREQEELETIRREAERMAAIVANLRVVARNSHEARASQESLDLNDVVRHVLRTRGYSLLTHNVEVTEDLDPGLPRVLGDRGQLEQVVLNLVVNAEYAMRASGRGGMLRVRTRGTPSGLALHVSDNGAGIAPGSLERIFDPFFTTKPPGEGTGLGLSLVHTIVAEHGGQIHVDSRVGEGTAFRVDLRAAAPAPAPGQVLAAAGSPLGVVPLRILVVDDEVEVRRVIARYLTRRGHYVEEAEDGGRALELLAAASAGGQRFDAIVSDLRMPGLSGTELLERLRGAGDGMEKRLVFLTGDTVPAAGGPLGDITAVPVLTKPVDLAVLSRFVEDRVI